MHEASLHKHNCFITLTYNNDYLPPDGSLSYPKYDLRKNKHGDWKKTQIESSDFQKFMKKLRKKFHPTQIRFFHAGEYGERLGRPHYHAILFGFDFGDKWKWRKNFEGDQIYRSEILESIWYKGFSEIGDVTLKSAAYVARYVTKKINGDLATEHYCEVDHETGEILAEKKPEYCTMSRRPGIAKNWFDKYKDDLYPKDSIHHNGERYTVPKYYDSLYELEDPKALQGIKNRRIVNANKHADNYTDERLETMKNIKKQQMEKLIRSKHHE